MKSLSSGADDKRAGVKRGISPAKEQEMAELKALGISAGPKKHANKGAMSSKAGSLGKKEREIYGLAKGNLSDKIVDLPVPQGDLLKGMKKKDMERKP